MTDRFTPEGEYRAPTHEIGEAYLDPAEYTPTLLYTPEGTLFGSGTGGGSAPVRDTGQLWPYCRTAH